MAQHDFDIANQTFPATRTDLNNALEALATLSSGATEPTTTYADMLWYDSGNNILKMRSEADDAWINVGYLCQSTNKFCILDDTNVVNTSGTQTGTIGDQATSAWEAGTSTTESLVSPAKVKAAVEALAPAGWGYESAATTLPANSATTFTHGLGAEPTEIDFDMVATSANSGYAIGDKIKSANLAIDPLSGRGLTIYVQSGNTTEIVVATGNSLRARSADGSTEVAINWNVWDIVLKARL